MAGGVFGEALRPERRSLSLISFPSWSSSSENSRQSRTSAAQETQKRFQMVFRRFLGVFARQEHPLALFLDDLQWLDAATLDLLEHLVTHPEVRHLLLVGAYRDNEVHPSGPLMRTLDEIRKSKAKVCDVVLAPLTLRDVEHLIGDSFHCALDHARCLAQLVQEKTAGNPFFVIQFILALVEDQLIAFDRSSAAWNWDLARIRPKGFTDNVVDLMVGKLSRLPDRTQDVFKLFACLGNTAEIATLAMVRGEPEVAIDSHLQEAVRVGLVLRLDRNYTFLHDRVQEAAYSLIPVDQRAILHLRIGRCLVAAMSKEKLTDQIFGVVNQFSRGAVLISDQDERAGGGSQFSCRKKGQGVDCLRLGSQLFQRGYGATWTVGLGDALRLGLRSYARARRVFITL